MALRNGGGQSLFTKMLSGTIPTVQKDIGSQLGQRCFRNRTLIVKPKPACKFGHCPISLKGQLRLKLEAPYVTWSTAIFRKSRAKNWVQMT